MGITCDAVDDGLDPRVRRTRKLLQEALRALVREKAFAAITVQDIAERATVNRATFYAHYTGKEALLAGVLKEDLHASLRQRFPQFPSATPENLVEIAITVFEFLGRTHASCPKSANKHRETLGTAVQEALYEMMLGWLATGHAARRLFPDVPKETTATVLSWTLFGSAHDWSRMSPRPPARGRCEEIVAVLLPNSRK